MSEGKKNKCVFVSKDDNQSKDGPKGKTQHNPTFTLHCPGTASICKQSINNMGSVVCSQRDVMKPK